MVKSTNSGDGERTAMLGYVPQYEIAANLIYEALLDGSLEWFRVADPDAGSLDDILIATTSKLDAYQVKWSEYTETISYSDFVRDSTTKSGDEKLSLFRQLTEGWTNLSEKYRERQVKVHLLNKRIPSSNIRASIPVGSHSPKHPHFQAFLKECWLDRSWCELGLDNASQCWENTLLDLKQRSRFSNEQFLKFVLSCELEFNYKRPSEVSLANLRQTRKQDDISKIYNLLTKMAGGERRIVELSKDDMLNTLSWNHKFKHKFVHEFPIDRAYQEIEETVSSLSDVLSTKTSGYIALLGGPGSGKSTTLTHTLKYKAGYKLVRYYAYVPDSTYQGRGEANTFLHDITLSLRNHGFRGENSGQPNSREEYLSLLGEQLQQANDKWRSDCVITIIMVDGLDHIQREQSPLQSLLSDLPLPTTLPDGIIFILGSQTLELNDLSSAIKEHIKKDNRAITISPLTRPNVYSAIEQWHGRSRFTDDEKRRIYEKSQGHPLSLAYLLQFIVDNSDSSIDDNIRSFPEYQGHIEHGYSIYWSQVEKNHDLINLLATLSRMRVPINTQMLEGWASHSTIHEFISGASHYFKKDNDVSWRFFHNSFKQFILDKTNRNLFGSFDESKNISYHKFLAEHCLELPLVHPMHGEVIYHLFNAKELKTIIELGKQSYFREQFFRLRNFSDITDDIDCVLLSAKELNDPLAVIRCILIECELREREDALNQIDVLNLLFASEGVNSAIDYIFDGQFLRVKDSEALSFAKTLVENGFVNEAKRIFDAAEPLSYLSGGDGIDDHHGGAKDLKLWVDVAHYFTPMENIISTIFQTRYKDDDRVAWNSSDEKLHVRLMKKLVASIYTRKEEKKINELFHFLSEKEQFLDNFLELCIFICRNKFPERLIYDAFGNIANWSGSEGKELDVPEKLLIAELDYKVIGITGKSIEYLRDIEQPSLYKFGTKSQWKNLSPFASRIRLNRLLAALGSEVEPEKAVPNRDDRKYTGNILFERNLVKFSNVWGKGWAGKQLSPSSIVQEIKPSFELLRKPFTQTRNWIGWYELETAAVDYFKFAIKATSLHGNECLLALADSFREDWSKRYWPTEWRREIAFTLYQEGDNRDALVGVLEQIEREIPKFDEVHSKITEYYELSLVWSEIGETARAASLVPKIFMGSFGIYHRKDRQFSHWVSWLSKLVEQHPEMAFDEICHFSLALVNLEQSGNGRGTQEAGRDLIAAATSWDAQYGLKLLKWLFDNKGIEYGAGLTGLLTGMLQQPTPYFKEILVATRKLLIPFEEYNPSDFSKQLTSRYCASATEDTKDQIEQLVTSIRTHLLPSNRYSWLEGVALGIRDAGLDGEQYVSLALSTPQEKHVTHEPRLKLKSGEELTLEEARLKAYSVKSLFQILRSVESVDYFQWENLLQPHISNIDVVELEELHKLLQPFSPDIKVVSVIAIALFEKGQRTKANRILESLLDNSDAKGWDLHWDGGSKQSIFKALVKMDSEKWRPKAIAGLVDDYISEYRYPSSLVGNLEELVDILFEDTSVLPLWKEIADHVYQLDDFIPQDDISPPTLSDKHETSSDPILLIQFAFDMLDMYIPELAHMSHQAIVEFSKVEENQPAIFQEISTRLTKVGLIQIKVMSLLKCLAGPCKSFVAQFTNKIFSLCFSNDFSVRLIAFDLSNELGLEGYWPLEDRVKLPLVYELELPQIDNKKEAIPFSAIRPGETLPDVDDPIELLRPLLYEVRLLEKVTNIPFENIVYRASELMKTLIPEDEWNKQAEEAYRKWMEGFGLKLTYHRLRPKVAKLALSHVVCELLDAGRIPLQAVKLLNAIFRRSDETLLSLDPLTRPEYIYAPQAKDLDVSQNHEDWLGEIEQAISRFADCTDTEQKIIGELTTWAWLDWDIPTEVRMSTICHPDWQIDTDINSPYVLFPSMMHWSANDYPEIIVTDEPSLVVYGSGAYIDQGGLDWLALNPALGFHLGWSLSSAGLFRWVDKNGEVMVESIYWKDGPISRQPPKMDDICSNGWVVTASKSAIEQIREMIPEVVKLNVVTRSYGRDHYNPTISTIQERIHW